MLLRYVYSTATGSKQLVGCVCRTDEGRLGYSAVHPKDRRKMSKKLARTIALGRAERCEVGFSLGAEDPDGFIWPEGWVKIRETNRHLVPSAIVPHLAALVGE